jgi:hypothetical protein
MEEMKLALDNQAHLTLLTKLWDAREWVAQGETQKALAVLTDLADQVRYADIITDYTLMSDD